MRNGGAAGRVIATIILGLGAAAASSPAAPALPFVGGGREQRAEERLQQQLRLELKLFVVQVSNRFRRVMEELQTEDPGPEIVHKALSMRLQLVPTFRSLLNHPDARIVSLDMWAFCAQLRQAFESRDDLGPGKALVLDAIRELLVSIRHVVGTHLDATQREEVERDVVAFARKHPLGQRFSTFAAQNKGGGHLGGTVVELVSAPLRTVNPIGGIDATADAIHSAVEVGDRMTSTIEHIPEVLLWEAELILHDLRTSPEIRTLLRTLEEFSASAAGLEETARNLPEQVGKTLAETEAVQVSLRETMAEARATLDRLTVTLERLEPLMASVERTAAGTAQAGTALEGAARAVQEMVASFGDDEESAEA